MRGTHAYRAITLATWLAPSCGGSQQVLEEQLSSTFTTHDMSTLVPATLAVPTGPAKSIMVTTLATKIMGAPAVIAAVAQIEALNAAPVGGAAVAAPARVCQSL
jgi:hypothetical protein